MSVTLTAAVSDTERDWHISEPLADGLVYLKADDEFVKVIYVSLDQLTIYVMRGVVDTTAATHAQGVALTAANAFSGGGGGVTVDNTVDPVAPIESFVIPGAVIAGTEADLSALRQLTLHKFSVTFVDDAALKAGSGIKVLDLAQGSAILAAFTATLVVWNSTDPALRLRDGQTQSIRTDDIGFGFDIADPPGQLTTFAAINPFVAISGPAELFLSLDETGTPTTGESDMYVLVASVAP